jgi:hypothetical protein
MMDRVGFTGTRRAVAVMLLCIFALLHVELALLLLLNGDHSGVWRVPLGFGLCYGLAAFALTAGWFWARWFANGIAWYWFGLGLMLLCVLLMRRESWQACVAVGVFGAVHGLIVFCLGGRQMAEAYELQPRWRERLKIDEIAVRPVGRAVTLAAAALPELIVRTVGPRPEVAGIMIGACGLLGLWGLIRLRTWGVFAVGATAAGLVLATLGFVGPESVTVLGPITSGLAPMAAHLPLRLMDAFAAGLLVLACLPFVRPVLRHLQRAR